MTTTSTLDLIDWATCLDDEPMCEDQDGCDRVAVVRLLWACRCGSELSCQECLDGFREYIANEVADGRTTFPCSHCDHVDYFVRSASDVVTVIPL